MCRSLLSLVYVIDSILITAYLFNLFFLLLFPRIFEGFLLCYLYVYTTINMSSLKDVLVFFIPFSFYFQSFLYVIVFSLSHVSQFYNWLTFLCFYTRNSL